MANPEPLSAAAHGGLKIKAAGPGTAHFVQVFDSEFAAAATRCPIVFTKNPATGAFYTGAIFGFKAGERLADPGEESFKPLVEQCEGFFLQGSNVAIDRAHARFSESEGEPLFDEAGEPAAALRRMQRVLGNVHAGLQRTQAFIDALQAARLIETIDVTMTFDDGERLTLQGLYTVSLDRLRDLDDATLLALSRAGHVQLAHIMSASLKQLDRLARVRNRVGRRETQA